MADFDDLTQRPFFDDFNIRRFKTNVVMRRSKVGFGSCILNSRVKRSDSAELVTVF